MRKNKKPQQYSIGLDIGVASVGFACIDDEFNIIKYRGRHAWGVREFDTANTAEARRISRSSRRKYGRRQKRIQLLQELFLPYVQNHPDFFRLASELLEKKWRGSNQFSGRSFTDLVKEIGTPEQKEQYKTIYHLRHELTKPGHQADPRFVYLAIHNLIKRRGHFLYEDLTLDDTNDDQSSIDKLEKYLQTIIDFGQFDEQGVMIFTKEELAIIWRHLTDKDQTRKDKKESVEKLLQKLLPKYTAAAAAQLLLGYKAKLKNLLLQNDNVNKETFNALEEMKDEVLELLAEEELMFLESAAGLASLVIWESLLSVQDAGGHQATTIAHAKVIQYDIFKQQKDELKELVKQYDKQCYKALFVSSKEALQKWKCDHDGSELCLFDQYLKMPLKKDKNKVITPAFFKRLKEILESLAMTEPRAADYVEQLKNTEDPSVLQKQTSIVNSTIPQQNNAKEIKAILRNQGYDAHFIEQIIQLLTFRIDYYVGPLVKNKEQSQFAWVQRIADPNCEDPRITPFTYNQLIDRPQSAENFIRRMTNKCSYLLEEDTLPKYSLLYQQYEVLNELNGVFWIVEGTNKKPCDHFTREERDWIIDNVFKTKKTVTLKALLKELEKAPFYQERQGQDRKIIGTQKSDQFATSLSSYRDFQKIYGTVDATNEAEIEQIIVWCSLFNDKELLLDRITNAYPHLSEQQLQQISKLRYSGFGRLSSKLLIGLADKEGETIMDHLINIRNEKTSPRVFQQIVTTKKFGYEAQIQQHNVTEDPSSNKITYEQIARIPGSPSIKRGIWQSIKIIEELVSIFGKPQTIAIEFAKDGQMKQGKRTLSREEQLKALKQNCSKELKPRLVELEKEVGKGNYNDDKAWLYILQNGKCLYTQEGLNLADLSNCEIDHILPRRFVKDDSLDNLALVLKTANQRKGGYQVPLEAIPASEHYKLIAWWQQLHENHFISDKKYYNLLRASLSEDEKVQFIQRQLVETRQISKHVANILQQRFNPEEKTVNIVRIKAPLVSKALHTFDIMKNRSINSKHHAMDAYMTVWLSCFIQKTYGKADLFEFSFREAQQLKAQLLTQVDANRSKEFFLFDQMKQWQYISDITGEVINAKAFFANIAYQTPCQYTYKIGNDNEGFFKDTIHSPKEKNKKKTKVKYAPKYRSAHHLLGVRTGVTVDSIYLMRIDQGSKWSYHLVDDLVINRAGRKAAVLDEIAQEILQYEQEYNGKHLKATSASIIRILPKKLLLITEGHFFHLVSTNEMSNAKQFVVTKQEANLIAEAASKKGLEITEEKQTIYHQLKQKVICQYQYLFGAGLAPGEALQYGHVVDLESTDNREQEAEPTGKDLYRLVMNSSLSSENIVSLMRLVQAGSASGKAFGLDRPHRHQKGPKNLAETTIIHQSITGLKVRREPLIPEGDDEK